MDNVFIGQFLERTVAIPDYGNLFYLVMFRNLEANGF